MEEKKVILKYATVRNQTIQAVIGEHFRFGSEVQARVKLASLEREFIHSKHRPVDLLEGEMFLWIKDFELAEEEKRQGFKGNFAAIGYKKVKSARGAVKYTLFARKKIRELKLHPQQQRQKTSHPNWGHPILRYVKKGKVYGSLREAEVDLQLLHEEYPTTTIPLGNKINVMVYSKLYEANVKKFLLEIKAHESGGFIIEIIERKGKKQLVATEAKPQQGKFTAMVELRRNKKKPK